VNKENLIQRLDAVHVEICELADQLGSEFWRLKPEPNGWNFEQIVSHLDKTTRSYRETILQVKCGTYPTPFTRWVPGYASLMTYLLKKALSPKNTKKSKTFPIWEPGTPNTDLSFMDAFSESQRELKGWIRSVTTKEGEQLICSPASRIVTYSLHDAFEIITIHQERHVIQARRLRSLSESVPTHVPE